ncbi:uncharacterized protein EAF02_011865 [Botrytis sinoallii]|uniref:uncharacterized protein n=1 Tax=Botrytis sinoallii TaxID=1463999 RepID=UPI001901F471|nr:uncharacterized protein EAF02_011865 [Botrytis sinoallii]KAF7853560.1 hypothetical protein EAF02_011865 [Botrytis sinoallii]
MILGSQADKATSSRMVNEIPSIQCRLKMQSNLVMVPSNTRLVNYQQYGRPSRPPIAKTESDKDEARIEFKALIAELMKLKLVLIDLGEARLEKSIQRKLIVAKKSLKVSKSIAGCQKGCFDEQRFIADEEEFVATRRAEVTSELAVLEDKIREVLDFQSATTVERENTSSEKEWNYLNPLYLMP